jgi:cytochrome c553
LATRGRWSKQVPACIACHGPQGVGVGAQFPPLAGQPAMYIANQLRDWQAGTRKNDPLDMMRRISLALDAPDITAVSEWFAAQPAVLKGERP